LVFGKRAGEYAASFANEKGMSDIDPEEIHRAEQEALDPLKRQSQSTSLNPYQLQFELQDLLQDKVGIIRKEDTLEEATKEIDELAEKAKSVAVTGNRKFNPGWHTALDPYCS
jgi:succinate dehydrogenase / fumarate reductase flavoprotein subunit